MKLAQMDWIIVDVLMSEMVAEGKEALVNAGLSSDSIGYSFSVDMRYIGQQTEVTVPLAEIFQPRRTVKASPICLNRNTRMFTVYRWVIWK